MNSGSLEKGKSVFAKQYKQHLPRAAEEGTISVEGRSIQSKVY
jgi:hypothetical protein